VTILGKRRAARLLGLKAAIMPAEPFPSYFEYVRIASFWNTPFGRNVTVARADQ